MDNTCNLKWLEWAKELQFLAQAGLTYTKDDFDKERFERIRTIANNSRRNDELTKRSVFGAGKRFVL